jgi:serine/threonine protein kinase
MAYVEVWKEGKLITRRQVDEEKARKGCRIRLGSAGQVRVKTGETTIVGKYEVRMFAGDIPETKQVTEEGALDLPGPAKAASTASTFSGTMAAGVRGEASYSPEIEGYKITGRLGEGGMGTVWRAVQLSTHREVALKLLSERRFESKKSRLRFVREVELTARLVHPNIARLYDSGLYRGIYYYAMELVDGVHLDQYVKEQNLSQRQILELMWIVCQAVHHAHKRGVIHRDLKPSNILVSQDGQPHVLDFGLAKAFLKESSDVTVSIEGDVSGTLAYMSPEQAMGRKEQMDTRTDVYSLGIILYQFLTGESPHELSGTRFEIIRRIVEEEVCSPREIKRDIDCDLEALLLKALARDPDDRYLSAGEMADDIDNYLNGKPLMARSPTTIYLLRKKIDKYRRHISIAAAVLVAFVGIVLFAYTQGVQSGAKVKVESQTKTAETTQTEGKLSRGEAETADTNTQKAELESEPLRKNKKEIPVAVKPLKEESVPTGKSQGLSEDSEILRYLSPADGEVLNATKIDLTWAGSSQGVSYDVFFGDSNSAVTDANRVSAEFRQNQTNKSFTATGLAFNKTYYWRVDMLKSDGNVIGDIRAVSTRLPPPSSELTVVNGSFESPTIAEAVAKGYPGESGKWSDTLRCNAWVGSKGGVCRDMAVDGNQCFYWYDPEDESIEQTVGYVATEAGKTYNVQYTRKIVAQPSIAKLKFRAELLVGGKVVDFEELNNASAIQEEHRLSYMSDGSRAWQPITIRFSADSSKRYTSLSEAQSVFIDSVLAFDAIMPVASATGEILSGDNVVSGKPSAVRIRLPPPSTEITAINGSFESPIIAEAIANGISGQIGSYAGLLRFKGWVGKGYAGYATTTATTMVAEGKQCFFWSDPQDEAIEQTLGYVSEEFGKTYNVEYTRQINAQPSIATLKFRAELLVGGRVVDFEEIYNASAGKGVHRLKYKSDGRSTGQPLTIRFTADSNKNYTNPSEAQRVLIDDVKCDMGDNARRTRQPAK